MTHSKRPFLRANPFSSDAPIYGAIDVGTTNCRMLIARVTEKGLEEVERYSQIVQLGAGLGSSNTLSDEAIERTVAAIELCKEKMAKYHIKNIRCVATEACRKAENSDVLIEAVQRRAYLNLDVISQEEEAQLALLGASPILEDNNLPIFLVDIGGGSTELILARLGKDKECCIDDWFSIPYGVVILSEQLQSGKLADYEGLMEHITKQMQPFNEKHPLDGSAQVVCTSGTITTLASLHAGLERYDRTAVDGVTMRQLEIHEAIHNLRQLSLDDLINHPCIGKDRARLMVSGCGILEAITSLWDFPEMKVADRGVRDGVIFALAKEDGYGK